MRIFPTIFAMAVAVISAPALAQTAQPLTATLEGSATDWTVLSDNGTTVILSSPRFGAKASGYRYYRFADDRYIVRDKRIIPAFAPPPAQPADTTGAYRQGWNDAIAAAAALRKP